MRFKSSVVTRGLFEVYLNFLLLPHKSFLIFKGKTFFSCEVRYSLREGLVPSSVDFPFVFRVHCLIDYFPWSYVYCEWHALFFMLGIAFNYLFFWEKNNGFVLQNLLECLVAPGWWWSTERLCETLKVKLFETQWVISWFLGVTLGEGLS